MSQAANRKLTLVSESSAVAAFHSVLVPIDLSPISDRVVSRVSLLPLTDHARVTLLHVVPGSLSKGEQRRAERDAYNALGDEVRHLRKLLPRQTKVDVLVAEGSAPSEIAACGSKLKSDLIVLGRSGGRPLRDALLGSTAERVIRQARLPVLAVQLPARGDYRRPLLSLDLDPTARHVIDVMLRVLPPPRPMVEVVHAFDTPYRGLIYPSLSEDDAEDLKNELRGKASRELAKLLSSVSIRREDGPAWKTNLRCGSPRNVVVKEMKKADTDLLVLGSRGFSGAAYLLLGTVAGDLLRAAKCDVLVVPPARR
jgi:nucleotide-binding universal stress UspA family protein